MTVYRQKLRFGGALLSAFMLLLTMASGAAAQEYLVAAGDVLEVSVHGNPDLLTVAKVASEGTITVPLVGSVVVAGLTVDAISSRIESLLAEGYLVDPQVSTLIREYGKKRATIMGAVKIPGRYEVTGQTSFLEVLSLAAGLSPDAGDLALIKRRLDKPGESELLTVDLHRLMYEGDATQDALIRDGDSIYVPQAGVFYVTGEIVKPGAYRFERGTTVRKAITLAGGYSDRADLESFTIIRGIDKGVTFIEIQDARSRLDMPLERGDSVFVPKAGVFYVTGEVRQPDAYKYEHGLSVIKAITLAGGFTVRASRRKVKILRLVDNQETVIEGAPLHEKVRPNDVIVVPESFF